MVVRIRLDEKVVKTGMKIGDIGLMEEGMTIIAIERKHTVLSFPGIDEQVQPGDQLLCYGEVAKIPSIKE